MSILYLLSIIKCVSIELTSSYLGIVMINVVYLALMRIAYNE